MVKKKVREEEIKNNAPTVEKKGSGGGWLKRLGFAGFMFFLVKGLVWLAILLVPAYFAC